MLRSDLRVVPESESVPFQPRPGPAPAHFCTGEEGGAGGCRESSGRTLGQDLMCSQDGEHMELRESGACAQESIEAPCPFLIPMHLFHLAVPELWSFIMNQQFNM